jgi:glycosyltransferase involved in cell wall biosynthesis
MKRVHVVTGLDTGGAETMLLKLVTEWQQRGDAPDAVISLRTEGTMGAPLRAVGSRVQALGLLRAAALPRVAAALARAARDLQPDLVQGWMYHGNLAAQLMAGAARRPTPCVWSIRQTLYDIALEKPGTARVIRAGAWLSPRAARIVYNSRVSAEQHEAAGFAASRRIVIPNGFDTQRFFPDPEGASALRLELALPGTARVVGMVARDHPMKNHAGVIRAVARLEDPLVYLLFAGRGVDPANEELCRTAGEAGLSGRIRLLGELAPARLRAVFSACDLVCSGSLWGEGFPNVLGEAMACGVPCVATDVGDSAGVIGETGRIVPAGDEAALAAAVRSLLRLAPDERRALGARARARIETEFGMARIAGLFDDMYKSVVEEGHRPRTGQG